MLNIEVNKTYINGNDHKIDIVAQRDKYFIGLNIQSGFFLFYSYNGSCYSSGISLNLVKEFKEPKVYKRYIYWFYHNLYPNDIQVTTSEKPRSFDATHVLLHQSEVTFTDTREL